MPSIITPKVLEHLDWGQAVLSVACLSFMGYIVSSIVAWNKLRHIPGPFLASFSYLWGFLTVSTGHGDRIMEAEQKKHGSIMRIGPDAIAINDPETLIRINGTRASYTKGPWYQSFRFDVRGHSSITEMNTLKHDKRKAKLTSGYSGRNMANLEAKIDKWISALIRCIRAKIAKGETTIDIGMLLQYFQMDLITEAELGTPWGDLADEQDYFGYLKMNDTITPILQTICWLPMARTIYTSTWFMNIFGPKTTDKAGIGLFLGVLEKEVEGRFNDNLKTSNGGHDILGEWIEHGLPAKECQFDLALQIPAGSETTLTTLRGILLLLMSSPVVYQKTKREVKDGITAGRISEPITNEEAKSLEYMQAVVKEGLRLMVPVNFGFPKRVPASGDTICDKFVPGGTDVYLNYGSLMRNQDVFGEDADVFRPERFLSGGPNIARMVKTVDLAFGYGRYMCLGRPLALMELNKIFVELLRNFDFQIANPEQPWKRKGYSTFVIHDFWAQVSEDTMG
ncbi:cytochrome P450 [Xylariaceae sp. AK1471]|nr:cytochrome P450 [Xylariaceae sp. AK1471]